MLQFDIDWEVYAKYSQAWSNSNKIVSNTNFREEKKVKNDSFLNAPLN